MLTALLILALAIFIAFFVPDFNYKRNDKDEEIRHTPQMKKLWSLAQAAMKERKPLKAEKALLTILKFDEKNAAAYNRLGILYAREKHYKEAIDCFEIAQSLDNNASSLHNVGLIYLETGKYEKAALAFEQAINLEGDQAGRYIAYAKALEKLGKIKQALKELEIAYSLNPSTVILRHILEIYENTEDFDGIEATKKRIEDLKEQKAKLEEKEKESKAKRELRAAARKANKASAKATKANAKANAKAEAKATKASAKAAKTSAKAAKTSSGRAAKTSARAARNNAKAEAKASKANNENASVNRIVGAGIVAPKSKSVSSTQTIANTNNTNTITASARVKKLAPKRKIM